MPEDGILKINGAQEPAPDRFTSLAFIKNIGGIQTQRNPFAAIDTRYNQKFLGGKPDALIAGFNIEITNSLTLARRPGLIPYGVSNVPAPVAFFDWELATTTDIILVIDTETAGGDNVAGSNGAVFNYSPTSSGIYVNKANLSGQTNFMDVVNTLYMGDGVDLYKIVGPNLLMWSNTFGTGAGTSFSINSPWTEANVFSLTGGQSDPVGGTAATQVTWGTTGSGAYIQQYAQGGSGVTGPTAPNYTPVASNTFTFSVWMQGAGETVTIEIIDQSGVIASQVCVLTSSWVKYQVTGTMLSSSTEVGVRIISPTSDAISMDIYGAQLEVGGPATTTQITTTKPQGVYLWGILAPTVTPTFTSQDAVGNTGLPWQPNHVYHVGDTIVDSNGNLEYATNDGLFSGNIASPEISFALASVASSTGVYTFTSPEADSAGNGLAGALVTITGFTNAANNVQVTITASNSTTFTTTNFASINETHAATATFGVPGSIAGTSGSTVPAWNTQQGQLTPDGVSGFLVQSNSASNNGGGALSVAFVNNVQNGNAIIVCLLVGHPTVPTVTDSAGDSFTSGLNSSNGGVNPGSSGDSRNAAVVNGQYAMYVFYSLAVAGGPTTVSVADAGENVYMAIAEVSNITALDHSNSFARNATSVNGGAPSFQTGGITTTNSSDLIMTFGGWIVAPAAGASADIGTPPSTYTVMTSLPPTSQSNNLVNVTTAYDKVQGIGFYNPTWTTMNPSTGAGNYGELGITGAFQTNVGTLQWYNLGENGAGLTADIGFQWYYSYGNSYTGHFSNVSPISGSTGKVTGQDFFVTGATRAMTNPGSSLFTPSQWADQVPWETDPQSDLIALYRNTDGGGFFYQVAIFGNDAAAQAALEAANYPDLSTTVTYGTNTWTYEDTTPDVDLNTEIFAPIGLLNSIPPAGLVDLEFFEGRMWGSVNNILYYNTSADNASLLSVRQNGVPSESWIPINFLEFNSFITRTIAVGGGLLVCTRLDIWLVTGQNLLTGGFNPQKELAGHGLRSYNAACLDGSTVYLYTSDREFLCINPNSGSVEFGYPIGDYLEENFSPLSVYIVRHVSGSRDNAVFMADGLQSWFRLNPNQQGASMSGEQTPVWSPQADFEETIGGIGAIASIETSAGVTKLLVGQTEQGGGTTYLTPYFNYEENYQFGNNRTSFTATFQPNYGTWQGNHLYTVGTLIVDSNGNVQRVTTGGTSGGSTPSWATMYGQTTSDGGVTWTAVIYAVAVGDTIVAPILIAWSGNATVTSVTDSSGNTWVPASNAQFLNSTDTWQVWTTIATANVAYGSALDITFNFSNSVFSGNTVTIASFANLAAMVQPTVEDQGSGASTWSSGSIASNANTFLLSASIATEASSPVSPWSSVGSYLASYNPGIAGIYSDDWQASSSATWVSALMAFPYASKSTASGAPVLVRDLDIFSDNGNLYDWSATIGSILLTTPGKVAEADSITTEMNNSINNATQCAVAVLLDEISGSFESLSIAKNDPPQLAPSDSVLSNRFYLNQGADSPTCRHLQIQLSGGEQTTKDEILAVTIRGALVPEQI